MSLCVHVHTHVSEDVHRLQKAAWDLSSGLDFQVVVRNVILRTELRSSKSSAHSQLLKHPSIHFSNVTTLESQDLESSLGHGVEPLLKRAWQAS